MPNYIHLSFDILAILAALITGYWIYHWRLNIQLSKTIGKIDKYYFLYLTLGCITGAYLFGTANLWLSGEETVGRSILGALISATAMVELYKWRNNITGSTGYGYVAPLCVCIIVGRFGCFFSGVKDFTHGTPSSASWAWDYGDGILRHPVQMYESLTMALFLLAFLVLLKNRPNLIFQFGFYLFTGFYASQRFVWEFYKPYQTLFWNLNIFHLLCLLFIGYSVAMITLTFKNTYYETEIS